MKALLSNANCLTNFCCIQPNCMVFNQLASRFPKTCLLTFATGAFLLMPGLLLSPSTAQIPGFSIQQTNSYLPDPVTALRQAIIGQESHANFRAVNRHSGALGYAQIMPANLVAWSQEALGRKVSRQEFLNNPAIQIAIIDFKLNQYWQRSLQATGGNERLAILRVAAWWYSGKPERYTSTRPQFYNGHRYPSIAAYSQAVLQRYHVFIGMNSTTYLTN
jgi:hypothetical protein